MIGLAFSLAGCSHITPPGDVPISSPHYVTFYEVQLVCPAAPRIGCGSAAKPLLLKLENQPGVEEAWLNRSGTIIAIVWEAATSQRQRSSASRIASGKELAGAPEKPVRDDFISRTNNWYRGQAVDSLSEEEAEIIAARLVWRTQQRNSLSKDTAAALHRLIAETARRAFLDPENNPRNELEDRARPRARDLLNEQQFAAFEEAYAGGWRPLPNEP
jgi:hypothetical protein